MNKWYVETIKDTTDLWKEKWVLNKSQQIAKLHLPKDRETYFDTLKYHVMLSEVYWTLKTIYDENNVASLVLDKPIINHTVYNDSKNNRTIGVGFNMDRKEAKSEWLNALGSIYKFVPCLNKKETITTAEAIGLFEYSLKIREHEVQKKFSKIWEKMHLNEQISLISLYYNSPKLLGPKISNYLYDYVLYNSKNSFAGAIDEIRYHSNPQYDKFNNIVPLSVRIGIQKRMDREAIMMRGQKLD